MIRHFLNPPNWFTSASIFCSVWAMTLLVGVGTPDSELLRKACVLVVFGGVFDLLDGRVARMTNRYSEFGVQLDSIADIISFGVAPALLAWAWKLHALGPVGAFVVFWYVLATSFRLARFNVSTAHGDWELEGHSRGLTSTMAGGILVTFVWVANGYLSEVLLPPKWFVALFVCALGLLMVSSVPLRTFRDIRRNKIAARLLAISLAACLTGAIVLDPSMWFGVGAVLYLTLGLLDGAITWVHHRVTGRALPGDDEEAELVALETEYATEEVG